MTWHYNGKVYDPAYEDIPNDVLGFVYIITDKETGEKYVGQKRMRQPKVLPIPKSRKRRVRSVVESDWRSYYSSNGVIKENAMAGHTERYQRDILRFGATKGDLNYLESKEQFDREVLLDDTYLNGIINCKIHKKHLSWNKK